MLIHPDRWGPLRDRYQEERPHRLLALDGGGIRGLITLGILETVEALIQQKTGKPLHEFFDYVAGTSTGAIIAAGIARGLAVADLISFYTSFGKQMFDDATLIERVKYLYTADPLTQQLKQVFGPETDLEPDDLKCLLLVVTKNVTTDSPWPISSNPDAKYNDPKRPDCNLRIPLWKLVRASTAAPVYFPAEVVQWDKDDPSKSFVFVDGGVTPYNNPAFMLYRMATEPAYKLTWARGEDKMFIMSVGTGAAESHGATAAAPNRNIVSTVAGLPGALMYGIQVDQDIACRTVGRCSFGAHLDRELMDLVPRDFEEGTMDEYYAAPKVPLSKNLGRSFLYTRYNADLSGAGLKGLGFANADPAGIQKMDAVDNIPLLLKIGRAAARQVEPSHFGSFL